MDRNDFNAINLVFDKYVVVDDGFLSFNSELKSLIDDGYISVEDALNIIFELMYGVIHYNYDEKDVAEESESLIEKVKGYNIENQNSIKNAVLFFKDYSHEKNLFMSFSSHLNIADEYKDEINLVFKDIESSKDSVDQVTKHYDSALEYSNVPSNKKYASISLEIREKKELDKEIRRLGAEIRKQYPGNWREILKQTPVYKKRHGLEITDENKHDSKNNDDLKNKSNIEKAESNYSDGNVNATENEPYKHMSKKELKKLEIRSDYLSNKIKYTIRNYRGVIYNLKQDLERINYDKNDRAINKMLTQLEDTYDDLIEFQKNCGDFKLLEEISEKIRNADEDLKIIKVNFRNRLQEIRATEFKILENKIEEYYGLMSEAESLLNAKRTIFSELNSKLNNLRDDSDKISDRVDKNDLLKNLRNISFEFKKASNNLDSIGNKFNKTLDLDNIIRIDNKISLLNELIDELNNLSGEYFEEKIIEQEEVCQNLLALSDEIYSENVEKLLDDFEKCFNRPMFKRQLRKYNLQENELDMVKNDIEEDIINHVIVGDDINFKDIIKERCEEFRRNNSEEDEKEIDELLDSIVFPDVDEEIIHECRNNVKEDFLEGSITINQVELKLNNYVNKKINESNQLKELEGIKNNPNVPHIKIHLTSQEVNEIYVIVEKEICGEYGIRGNVEDRVYFLVNKKIRKNKSEARGRLNIIKRDLSNSTQLNKRQQVEFIRKIEFLINENEIKYYDIHEENIIRLSHDFINYGEIRLR